MLFLLYIIASIDDAVPPAVIRMRQQVTSAAGPAQLRLDAAARHRARRRERQKERRHQERDAEFGEFQPVQAPAHGGDGTPTPSRFQAPAAAASGCGFKRPRPGTRPSDQKPAKRAAASMRSTRGGFNKRAVRSFSIQLLICTLVCEYSHW